MAREWEEPGRGGWQAIQSESHVEELVRLSTTLSETDFRSARETYDRQLVAAALERSGGRIKEASRLLGLSRNGLKGKMRRYGLM